jgi:type II secretory pathway predicted ATPase ExeA
MDLARFGLRQRPFPTTPDTVCYYPATSHEEALHQLLTGLVEREGTLVLTGGAGTGKTLLCHRLLEFLGSTRRSVFLTNSHFADRAALLQAILFDLSLPYAGKSEQELRLALTEQLLDGLGAGQWLVLIVDEAHLLAPDLLEELRLLGNLEARSGKAMQVLLVGQPTLRDVLSMPALTLLQQRTVVRAELVPLSVEEAADYLLHHVRVAGGKPERVFEAEALEVLARATRGVPRLLNQAAHLALGLAEYMDVTQVDAEAALEALARLGLEASVEEEVGKSSATGVDEEDGAAA